MIPSDEPVRLLSAVLEELDYRRLTATYSRLGRIEYSPRLLFKVVLYGCMRGIGITPFTYHIFWGRFAPCFEKSLYIPPFFSRFLRVFLKNPKKYFSPIAVWTAILQGTWEKVPLPNIIFRAFLQPVLSDFLKITNLLWRIYLRYRKYFEKIFLYLTPFFGCFSPLFFTDFGKQQIFCDEFFEKA